MFTADLGWGGEVTLILPDGTFRWIPNIWHTNWTLRDKGGLPVMQIELSGFINIIGRLSIEQPATSKLSLLALLGWYLIMNVLSEDTSSGAAIVATMH